MALSLPRALRRTLALAALLSAGPLAAADLALVLANWDYRHLEDTPDARELRGIADRLDEVGFEVIEEYNADAEELRAAAASFGARAEDADRVLIVLDGHLVSTGTDAWLLGRDARDPGRSASRRRPSRSPRWPRSPGRRRPGGR